MSRLDMATSVRGGGAVQRIASELKSLLTERLAAAAWGAHIAW